MIEYDSPAVRASLLCHTTKSTTRYTKEKFDCESKKKKQYNTNSELVFVDWKVHSLEWRLPKQPKALPAKMGLVVPCALASGLRLRSYIYFGIFISPFYSLILALHFKLQQVVCK
jgi:hypothetical protein